MESLLPWAKFAVIAGAIGIAGTYLTRYGDIIARLTGLSRSWIGLILLATATSLPELLTGITAVAAADAPNIAMGDALGSCVFNLAMLVLLDELSRTEPMYRRIDQGHILTAGFGVILIGAAGAFILLSQNGVGFQIGHVSGYTPLIILIYAVAVRAAFSYERRVRPALTAPAAADAGITLRGAALRYGAAAAAVVAAGPGPAADQILASRRSPPTSAPVARRTDATAPPGAGWASSRAAPIFDPSDGGKRSTVDGRDQAGACQGASGPTGRTGRGWRSRRVAPAQPEDLPPGPRAAPRARRDGAAPGGPVELTTAAP